jgi:amidophosphoribosyltransferase
MCGIAGLYIKNPEMRAQLGKLFKPMLIEMTDRGPDSAGFAVYGNPVSAGRVKVTVATDEADFDWKGLDAAIEQALNCDVRTRVLSDHAVIDTDADEARLREWLKENQPDMRIVGSGQTVEIFKQVGLPERVAREFDLENMTGSHIIGHTRMATESAVTTAGSHPFATGQDLCLVHNGSLSNHNRLRRRLQREGIEFQTDNDTEVAAGYMTWQLRNGLSLREVLTASMEDLDGFYTFCVGTADGFAVLRDPIACKHAVLAENDDWVAMATEYRAIAPLPGADKARIWEPAPATIYSWGGSDNEAVH